MNNNYELPSEEEDSLFSNIIFNQPIVFTGNTNHVEALNEALSDGLIPIVKIIDKENQFMIDIINSKPEHMKDLEVKCVIFAIQHKENYLA